MSYDYRVTFVTDYLTITTNVCLEDEIGKIDETIINDITVTLLLDDEEIELGGFGEFPPVHVSVIEVEGE